MHSFTSSSFWKAYEELPPEIQKQADEKFKLWKENPFHPGLHYKCVNSEKHIWSARINRNYRSLGIKSDDDIIWFWIGNHDDYMRLI